MVPKENRGNLPHPLTLKTNLIPDEVTSKHTLPTMKQSHHLVEGVRIDETTHARSIGVLL